ncbi:hypothetical protein NUU61_000871 [Penicillium alfredii]|uniref:Uncharacterized protein n=1 Tax=Penicillium alfredii TaxID=1506179 RepID=A0A9W9KRB9_9EURO|nr:uncharacterized protein NUU61_000871 [Penicillium alfredii]KAJ5115112.1 hypothetical protein NUU61_000871 [Penicillium alfredii]
MPILRVFLAILLITFLFTALGSSRELIPRKNQQNRYQKQHLSFLAKRTSWLHDAIVIGRGYYEAIVHADSGSTDSQPFHPYHRWGSEVFTENTGEEWNSALLASGKSRIQQGDFATVEARKYTNKKKLMGYPNSDCPLDEVVKGLPNSVEIMFDVNQHLIFLYGVNDERVDSTGWAIQAVRQAHGYPVDLSWGSRGLYTRVSSKRSRQIQLHVLEEMLKGQKDQWQKVTVDSANMDPLYALLATDEGELVTSLMTDEREPHFAEGKLHTIIFHYTKKQIGFLFS